MNIQDPTLKDREVKYNLYYEEEYGCMGEYDHVEQFDELAPLLKRLIEVSDGHLNEEPIHGPRTKYSINYPAVTITIDLSDSDQLLINEAIKTAEKSRKEMYAKRAEAHALQNQKDQQKQDGL